MGGNKNRLVAGIQGDLQKIAAVKAQDRTAVGVDIADGLKPGGQGVRRVQGRQDDYVMYLADPAVFFID